MSAEPQGQHPENRSSLSSILLVTTAMLAVYYGYTYFFAQPSARSGSDASSGSEPASAENVEARRAARAHLRQTGHIRTDAFEATVDNLGGGLGEVRLSGERFRDREGVPENLVTTQLEDYLPLRISIPGVEIPPDVVWELTQENDRSVLLRWRGDRGIEVQRRIEAGTVPYQIWQTVFVRNGGLTPRRLRVQAHAFHYVRRAEESSGLFSLGGRSTRIGQGLCRHAAETTRKSRSDLATAHGYPGPIDFVGIENQYFVQALAPSGQAAERCGLWAQDRYPLGSDEVDGTLFEAQLRYPVVTLAPGDTYLVRTMVFFGPKDWSALESAGHALREVVDLGTFAVIARQFARLLAWIHDHVGNWGLAIIILTLLVRIALYPVMARQFRAFAPMRKLKPELDAINARFPDDMERRQAAVLELYKKHGINPATQMLGCLPVLLQMPVFFALYTSLSTNIELYHQPFVLWWTDLSGPDPYFSLPVALSALMHVQQRLTPTQMDPAQQRVMLWAMPIMMGVFMLFLPSGLCLYMLTNSTLSIAQQRFNEWRWQKEEAAKDAAAAQGPTGSHGLQPAGASAGARTSRSEALTDAGASAKGVRPSKRRPPRG